MVINLDRVYKDDRLCKSLTGMKVFELNNLLASFESSYLQLANSKQRQRKFGGGRRGVLPTFRHRLFFILFYFKCYPTFDVAAFFIGTVRSKSHSWVKKLIPIIESSLGRELVLPERKIDTIEKLFRNFPESKEIFIDGTEREIQRSKNNNKNNKRRYSGKKKRHCRKNIIISSKKKDILYLSPTRNGRKHDFKITKAENIPRAIPPDKDTYVDTGFQGIKDMVENPDRIHMPKKKLKNKHLSPEDKEMNQIISSIRIKVEHAIGGIKKFNCLSHTFRNKKGQDDKFINIISGLWNYHLRLNR